MNQVILDSDLRAKLNGLHEQTTLLNESGEPVGFFLPLDTYRKILSSLPIPFSDEEMARRRQETGGIPLAEFWKTLGVQRGPAWI